MKTTLHIGRLEGGGIVLGYRCPSCCRHCPYGCGPHRRDGEARDEAKLEAILDLLAERAPHARYHIGGGEPFLFLPTLRRAIQGLRSRGMCLDYVETNASWVTSEDQAATTLEDLAEVGLAQVLVSVSPFHAEYVPPARPRMLIGAAERVLSRGAFEWISDFWPDVSRHCPTERLDLKGELETRGAAHGIELARRYGVVPAGRAGRLLSDCGLERPWQEVARTWPCASRLRDTTHFHVDLEGQYVPGLCAGLVLPLEAVPGAIDLERYPVLAALVRGGPEELVSLAREYGFRPLPSYSSACDLCTHARLALDGHGFSELGPTGFYDERSLGVYG